MSTEMVHTPTDERSAAAEVLELGEALFDAVIAAAATRPSGQADIEEFPADDVRAAADEFFAALRILLGLAD